MTAAFTHFADEVAGASAAIKVCSIVVIIIGILNFIFIEDTKEGREFQILYRSYKGYVQGSPDPESMAAL